MMYLWLLVYKIVYKRCRLQHKINKFSTVMTSPGPALQECTGSCHENVPAPKVVSSDLRSPDSLTVTICQYDQNTHLKLYGQF